VLAGNSGEIRPDRQGGRVIDPSRKLNAIRDVAIAHGRYRGDRGRHSQAGAGETGVEAIDARGKLVVPG